MKIFLTSKMKIILSCLVVQMIFTLMPQNPTPALAAKPPLKQPIQKIIAFGDSLTDNGYADGFGFLRHTNGPVWVEYLAELLGHVKLEDRAWGGATSSFKHMNGQNWAGLQWQISDYLQKNPPAKQITPPLATTLFTVWIGANDFFAAGLQAPADTATAQMLLGQTLDNVLNSLKQLLAHGAQQLIVFNLPDFSEAPGTQKDKPYFPFKANIKQLIENFNTQLQERISGAHNAHALSLEYPHAKIYFIDAFKLFKDLKAQKMFKNTADAWYPTLSYPAPDAYMWYDDWHPMTEVHKQIALLVYQTLKQSSSTKL